MKRFKKLTVYILVGVLSSSAVMMSYKKAETVEASAAAFGTGALLMVAFLGACGIVYKGAVDSATGNYVWENNQARYEEDTEKMLQVYANIWNAYVNILGQTNGYDPDDDWDGDEEKPRYFHRMVEYFNTNHTKTIAMYGTALASMIGAVAYQILQTSSMPLESRTALSTIDTTRYGMNIKVNIIRGFYDFGVTDATFQNYINQYSGKILASARFGSSVWIGIDRGSMYSVCFDISTNQVGGLTTNSLKDNFRMLSYDNSTGKVVNVPTKNGGMFTVSAGEYIYIPWGVHVWFTDGQNTILATEEAFILESEDLGLGTGIDVDGGNSVVNPIIPSVQLPNENLVTDFLGGLSTNVGNEQQTQQVVDEFIQSLQQQQQQPNPDPGLDPGQNPGTNPGQNPGQNPGTGEEGGSSGEQEEDNSSLLADLKDVFPFCIPFDLIDCFRVFNAEPVTPRVEIPMHFGIVDVDYTFVIDLEDFDGVAEVCRTMFLLLFIVGLVLATRELIRG